MYICRGANHQSSYMISRSSDLAAERLGEEASAKGVLSAQCHWLVTQAATVRQRSLV